MTRSINIAILAMGGEGGGVLADWLVDLAEHHGFPAQSTSVPGVAQRTGATIYYVEIFPETIAAQRRPVLALMPMPGDVDLVIASELMEAGRAIQRGLVTPDRTTLVASTHRVYSMTEKTAMGDGRVDPATFIEAGRTSAKHFVSGDFARAAEASNSVISAVLFGAVGASGALPFPRAAFEDAIRRGGVGVEASLAAFAEGVRLASAPVPAPTVEAVSPPPAVGPRLAALAERIRTQFPPAAGTVLTRGILRLADYQDEAYAGEYLDRLDAIRDLAPANGDARLLVETARGLALWMSYEDTIRVADLKTRRTRFERVAQEVRLHDDQLLSIHEFLHPRVEEIADTLPAAWGRWLLRTGWARRWIERFTTSGRVVRTSSLRGYLLLYGVANLRRIRRGSLRYGAEQARISGWLARIRELAVSDPELALATAECQRLVKGYGDTHVRGVRNFESVMSALPGLIGRPDGAARLRRLRDAALADEPGQRLAQELLQQARAA